jgi:hypothetical protein
LTNQNSFWGNRNVIETVKDLFETANKEERISEKQIPARVKGFNHCIRLKYWYRQKMSIGSANRSLFTYLSIIFTR